jgi:hypothetical protein
LPEAADSDQQDVMIGLEKRQRLPNRSVRGQRSVRQWRRLFWVKAV